MPTQPLLALPCSARFYLTSTCMRAVQDAGADPNCRDTWGCSPLYFAAAAGDAAAVQRLISQGALCTPNNDGQTPLHFASQEGHLAVVNMLLSGPSGQEMVRMGWQEDGGEEIARLGWCDWLPAAVPSSKLMPTCHAVLNGALLPCTCR